MWIALVLLGVVILVTALLLLPRARNQEDGPLPPEVETRLLLGEDPDEPGPAEGDETTHEP